MDSLKEGLSIHRITKSGKRLPYIQNFDILYYQAALTFQRYFRRDQSKKEIKLAVLRSKKLKPMQEFDEDQYQKIQSIFESNRTFMDKQAFDKLMTKHQVNAKLQNGTSDLKVLSGLKSVSYCPSPYIKIKEPEVSISNRQSIKTLKNVQDPKVNEAPDQQLQSKPDIIQSINDFESIGFFIATDLGQESLSVSGAESST